MLFDTLRKKHAGSPPVTSRLVMDDAYGAAAAVPGVQTETHREVSILFTRQERAAAWVCPNCECENPTNHFACCVCGTRR